jgi:hypothetical protein
MIMLDSTVLADYARGMKKWALLLITVLAASAGAMAQGSATGGTISGLGTITVGHCAEWASTTQIEDAGAACGGGGGGSGTVTSITIAPTANQISVSGTCTITTTGTCTLLLPSTLIAPGSVSVPGGALSAGTDGTTAGLLSLSASTSTAHTIFGSAATTTNTILGPATAITTGHVLTCTTVGTVCTLTDGGASGSITGSGTTNTMAKFTAATAIGNSQVVDDGTHPVQSPNGFDAGTAGAYNNEIANNATTGTVLHALLCNDGTGHGIVCPTSTSTTNQPYGSVTNNQGTSGNATFAILGFVLNYFDNQSVVGDYAIASTTTAGYLHDTGSTTLTAGQPNYFVWTANSGANTTGYYRLLTADDFIVSSGTSALPGGSLYSLQYQSPLGTFAGTTPPTANGIYGCGYNVTGGVAVAPTCQVAGIPTNAQTGTTYTYLYSDRTSYTTFSNASAVAVTLPQASSTGFGTNWNNVSCDIGAGTATITPTTSTISYSNGTSYTAGASSLPLTTGQCAFIYSNNTNYSAILLSGGGGGGGCAQGTCVVNAPTANQEISGAFGLDLTNAGSEFSVAADNFQYSLAGGLSVTTNGGGQSFTDTSSSGFHFYVGLGGTFAITSFASGTLSIQPPNTSTRFVFPTNDITTQQGNGAALQLSSGSTTTGDAVAFDANGNTVDSGVAAAIAGTTGSIGGGALAAGACTSGTASVTGATTSMVATASPVTYPGDAATWKAYVSAAGTVTVKVCAIVAVTPTASAYNVRVQ